MENEYSHENMFNRVIVEFDDSSYIMKKYSQKRMLYGVLLFNVVKGSPCTYKENHDRRRCIVKCNEDCAGHLMLKSELKELLIITTPEPKYCN
jgi:hypothetical protein